MILSAQDFVIEIGSVEADNIAGLGGRDERTLDWPRLEAVATGAQETIVGYIGARYPVIPPSEMLKAIAVTLCLYQLRLKTGDTSGVNEEIRRRYEAAIKRLEDIAAGKLLLPGAPGAAGTGAAVSDGGGVVMVRGEAPRAPGILQGWLP